MIIRVDIDNTICKTVDGNYENATPIRENIEKINKLYKNGNTIIYWSSRGTLSGIDWFEMTKKQLMDWGCLYHQLELMKPFYDLLICDRSIRIEEL